jgi:ATP-binding cassette, subfamily B, bacterial
MPSDRNPLWRLLRYVRPYRGYMALAIAAMLLSTAGDLAAPLIVREALGRVRTGLADGILAESLKLPLLGLAALLFLAYVVKAAGAGLAQIWSHEVGYGVVKDVRTLVYDHIQRLSLGYFQERQTGKIMAPATSDVATLELLIAHAIRDSVLNGLVFVGASVILLRLHWQLGLLVMLPVPLILWLAQRTNRRARRAHRQVQEKLADISGKLQDNISGIRVIQSFTTEDHEREQFDGESRAHYGAAMRTIRTWGIMNPVVEVVAQLSTVAVISLGGWLALQRQLRLEDLVAFLMYAGYFYRPILALGHINDTVQQTLAGATRIWEVLDTDADVQAPSAAKTPARLGNRVEFRDVRFSYREEVEVLHGVTFACEPGKMTALVGSSGAGKTTLVNLIPRFYDVDDGAVVIGGEDVRDLDLTYLRRQISMVLQDVFLFAGSVAENIAYGKLRATREEVIRAAKMANAHEFIEALENGYDTVIGERGVKLSGGQKQRLSIARAILKDAPILILDEATSSVDTETEVLIQEALEHLTAGRTTIAIAHRLSTIQHADKIVVLDQGRVAEEGTHAELLRRGGLYRKLYEIQFRHQERATLADLAAD